MKRSQLAINSVSLKQAPLEEMLAACRAAGFPAVELWLKHVRDWLALGRTPADVGRLLDSLGLECIGGFETAVLCFAPAAERRKNHARVVENARLLGSLGARTMVVGTDGPEDRSRFKDLLDPIARTFGAVARRIRRTGVTLCLEFNWSPIVKSLRTAAEVARRSGEPNVGVLFDPAHYHCTPTKLDQLDSRNVPFIRHVHVDDMADKPGELSNCNTDRALPGKGCLDLREIFGRLERHGYRGRYAIEMFSQGLWSMSAAKAARIMYRSLLPYCGG